MLSGERLNRNAIGTTMAMIAMPDIKAAGRQPQLNTMTASSGVTATPPSPVPVDAMDMAKLFFRMNHWLTAGMVALL